MTRRAAPEPIAPEILRRVDEAGLPEPIAALLRDLAERGSASPAATRELVEELVDHFASGLEAGRSAEDLLGRFLAGSTGHRDSLVTAAARRSKRERASRSGSRAGGAFALGLDLRAAGRSLARRPLTSLGNVATLALGIAAAVTLFALFEAILVSPLPFEEPDELYSIREKTAEGRTAFPSYPNFADWRRQGDLFDGVASTTWGGHATVLGGDRPLRVRGLGVSLEFLSTLGVRPVLGRDFEPEECAPGGPPAVLVSEELWSRALGGERELGRRSLTIGRESYRVVGIVPRGFRALEPAELYLCHERYPGTHRGAHAYQVLARLATGVAPAEAQQRLDAVMAAIQERHPDETDAVATDWTPLRERLLGDFDGVVAALFGASLLVLLVACSDVGASLLAQGRRRRLEIAVRRSMGATHGRLALQLLGEALLIALPALLLGSGLAVGALRTLRQLGAEQIPRLAEVQVDGRTLTFALATTLVATIGCGLFPIRQALGVPAADVTRGGAASARRGRGWGALIGAQVAVAFLLLTGAGLLARSLQSVIEAEVGFDVRGVAAAHVHLPESRYETPAERLAFTERYRRELESLPGVERTALTTFLPYDWGTWTAPVVGVHDPEEWLAFAGWRLVTPEYFSILDIPILEGRPLPADGRVDGTTAVVVNQSVARKLVPGGSAVGQLLRSNFDPREEWLTVVGVVGEARHWRAEPGAQPEIYVHQAARPESVASEIVLLELDLTDGGVTPASLFRAARERLRTLDPDVPADIAALTDTLRDTAQRERLAVTVLGAFAALVLLLTLVGIGGVVARAVAERRREAGIRQSVGATPGQVARLFQGEILLPVAAGLLGGGALAAAATRSLESLLHGVAATDPVTYLVAGLMLAGASFLASLMPARRVTRESPVEAIRGD